MGIYWTYDPNSVSAYWGDTELPLWILVGKVKENDIDWNATVAQYMKPEYAESEIRLKDSAKPKLLKSYSSLEDFWSDNT